MKQIFLLFSYFLFSQAQAQLSFSELGSEPAYCRLFGYQTGNGLVYAAATGGTPDYTYLWTDLQSGSTNSATVWGGLNPGCYEIMVTDGLGATLIDTVCVDSVMPIADFELTDGSITPTGTDFYGFGTSNGRFISTSQNICNPLGTGCDTALFWNFSHPSGAWWLSSGFDTTYWQSFYVDPGTYDIAHVTININGCSDTVVKTVNIFGPLEAPTEEIQNFSVTYQFGSINFKNPYDESVNIQIFDITGQVVFTDKTSDYNSNISLEVNTGVYLVQLENKSGAKLTEKIIIP